MNRHRLIQLLLHALAAAIIVILPGLWLGEPLWRSQKSTMLTIGLFAAAYFICAAVLAWRGTADSRNTLSRVVLAGAAAFGLAFVLLAFAEWRWPDKFGPELPRIVPLTMFAGGMALLVGLVLVRKGAVVKAVLLAAILAIGVVAQLRLKRLEDVEPAREVSYVDTSLYVLKTTAYRNWVSDAKAGGGAIVAFGDGYLLAGGDGRLHYFTEDDSALQFQELGYRVPFNPQEFDRDARAILAEGALTADLFLKLRVSDLLLQELPGDSIRLFVSHHYWKQDEDCAVVRVSVLEGARRELLAPGGRMQWRSLYDSSPCLALNLEARRGVRFAALQSGGAMAMPDEGTLLLTVGDHEFDGWNRSPPLPQETGNSYGKVMRIRLDTGASEIYSMGHRNPQGLHVDASGDVWATEHGPKGGDELNRIRQGVNYGWPLVTYGTEYMLHSWPLSAASGRHEGFEKPILAFTPSLALTALTGISGKLFESWNGDLVLVSLTGEVRRVRIEEGRATVAEPFTIGQRVRDIAQGRDGRLVLWSDRDDLIFVEPAATGSAETLVFQCTGCHSFAKAEHASIGPNLYQVVGRQVAGEAEFTYSAAMRKYGGRWTRERLDEFLADPDGVVPGTSMQFEGIADPAEREQLIEFLDRR